MSSTPENVLVAGAGMAGLASALALAATGRECLILERAPVLEEVGAGLQLSPNATRILRRLGVLDRLDGIAARPLAVVLVRADTGRELARIPLGRHAETRWGAPYLTVHRADLQRALAGAVEDSPSIGMLLGAAVEKATTGSDGVRLTTAEGEFAAGLLIAADGVRSDLRALLSPETIAKPTGHIAWRVTALLDDPAIKRAGLDPTVVTTFLHPDIHLVCYPIRGGKAFNLVAISQETGVPDSSAFPARLAQLASAFSPFGAIKDWLAWPLNAVGPKPVWRHGERVAYVGDAAHAVTPFAAQGAAMAIEDAATLARSLNGEKSPANALTRYAAARDPRLARVAKRGAFNHFSWHAAGPMALARDMTLSLLGGRRLAAQLDWLYGHDADAGH